MEEFKFIKSGNTSGICGFVRDSKKHYVCSVWEDGVTLDFHGNAAKVSGANREEVKKWYSKLTGKQVRIVDEFSD